MSGLWLVPAAVLLTPTPAGASSDTTQGGAIVQDGMPTAIVVTTGSGSTTTQLMPGVDGGGSEIDCRYYANSAGNGSGTSLISPDYTTGPITPEPDQDVWFECTTSNGEVVYREFLRYNPADPLSGLLADQRAAQQARNQIPLPNPTIHTNPPHTTNHITGIPTTLTTTDPWTPRTATATIGNVSATITATPTHTTWTTGDTTPPTTCTPTTTCTHTWHHTGTWPLTATTTWTITWTATTGTNGTLPPLTRTTTTPITTTQTQAVLR